MLIKAIAILFDTKFNPRGQVLFSENPSTKRTDVNVYVHDMGLKKGLHGFHIHESGDLSKGCDSLCAHYNPHNRLHGGPRSKTRHLGDLGNVKVKKNGKIEHTSSYTDLPLRGKHSIIGRSVIIHEDQDDLGRGGTDESLKTGNAGKRVLCGVIGYRSGCT